MGENGLGESVYNGYVTWLLHSAGLLETAHDQLGGGGWGVGEG